MSGNTPGPWVVSYGIPFCKRDGDCLFFPNRGEDEIEANALLIAAAPDLLEALRCAQNFIKNGVELGYIRLPEAPDSALDTPAVINAAIAKANGKQP